ncbi:MAG: DUF2007 domain-containing protein [Prevotellaceae bacterium]|jgi:hypothetical protein|nr:DUF2007 domain-containing protein [Prevotellaceae bacterium]
MEKGWVKIYESADTLMAEILRQSLEENDICAVLLNQRDSSYLAFGSVELYVHESNRVEAEKIIAGQ